MTLVSIITICYNAEKLIAETMYSVLNQSFENIEYIIIDGNSKDKTLEIVKGIAAAFPSKHIKIVSEADQGIADAMNKGIVLANGELIAHLHAGDRYINKTVIEKVMDSYRQNRWRWGVAGSIVVDSLDNERYLYRPGTNYKLLLKKNCIPHQSTFIVKDIFNKYGLFKVEYKQAMDYEFWLRIAFKGNERFTVLPFNTTYFLDAGRSSKIFELLKYLIKIRKAMRTYNCNASNLNDWLFFARVIAFHAYYKVKTILKL